MIKIFENFYQDPDQMREYALSRDFNVSGNYPGLRTDCCDDNFREYLKGYLEGLMNINITNFGAGYNTAFQATLKDAQTWIHYDGTQWAGVLYLTPDAPASAGTGIFRHRETGIYMHHPENSHDFNEVHHQETDWELIAMAGNVYNRLVIYRGEYYHRSILAGFGDSPENGRLFQTFFFDGE